MSKTTETCSIDIEDSRNISFGNIHSDADKVFKVQKVDGLKAGDIYHFVKSEQEIDQIFSIIKTIVDTSTVDSAVKDRALELSQEVKTSYQSKNSTNFGESYSKLIGFLSDHNATLGVFMLPILENLIKITIG